MALRYDVSIGFAIEFVLRVDYVEKSSPEATAKFVASGVGKMGLVTLAAGLVAVTEPVILLERFASGVFVVIVTL